MRACVRACVRATAISASDGWWWFKRVRGAPLAPREGVWLGALATALGMLSVMVSPGFNGAHLRFISTFLFAGGLGLGDIGINTDDILISASALDVFAFDTSTETTSIYASDAFEAVFGSIE